MHTSYWDFILIGKAAIFLCEIKIFLWSFNIILHQFMVKSLCFFFSAPETWIGFISTDKVGVFLNCFTSDFMVAVAL